MMAISYRKATANDIDNLSQMRVLMLFDREDCANEMHAKIYNNTKQYIADGLIDNNFIVYVAAHNEKIVAMGGISFFNLPPNDWCPDGKTAYIGNMFTLTDYRKHGIATKILSLLVEEAETLGCERILLNPTDMGKPVYEKYGFEPWSYAMAYYPKNKGITKHQDR
jgi:GNAT superfamily N-acetyltransferase